MSPSQYDEQAGLGLPCFQQDVQNTVRVQKHKQTIADVNEATEKLLRKKQLTEFLGDSASDS